MQQTKALLAGCVSKFMKDYRLKNTRALIFRFWSSSNHRLQLILINQRFHPNVGLLVYILMTFFGDVIKKQKTGK